MSLNLIHYCPQASSGWFTLSHKDHQGTWNAWASPRLLMLGDFLSLFQSESRRMWYTISLPTIYGENHHCHTKYSGGIPVALDKKIKRSCQSPAWIQGTRTFWLQDLIWTCEAFYGWYVTCQSGDCPYFLVASRVPPRGLSSFPEPLFRFCCRAETHAGREVTRC